MPRAQRTCPHCQGGLEDVQHALFVCHLYSPVRASFPDLVFEPTVYAFLEQDPVLIVAFVAECQSTHARAHTPRPPPPPWVRGRRQAPPPPLSKSGLLYITYWYIDFVVCGHMYTQAV